MNSGLHLIDAGFIHLYPTLVKTVFQYQKEVEMTKQFVAIILFFILISQMRIISQENSLRAWIERLDDSTLNVQINGVDTKRPTDPFDFNWGDGTITTGWFPQHHTYNVQGDFQVRIVSHYQGGTSDSTSVEVVFKSLRQPKSTSQDTTIQPSPPDTQSTSTSHQLQSRVKQKPPP